MFGDEANVNQMEDITIDDFGRVGEVVVTKDDTLFMEVSKIKNFKRGAKNLFSYEL